MLVIHDKFHFVQVKIIKPYKFETKFCNIANNVSERGISASCYLSGIYDLSLNQQRFSHKKFR